MADYGNGSTRLRVTKLADGSIKYDVLAVSVANVITVSASCALPKALANDAGAQQVMWTGGDIRPAVVKEQVAPK